MRVKPLCDLKGFFGKPRRADRPTKWYWWPIRVGWVQGGGNHAFLCWHGWPAKGSDIWPDATYKNLGWTLHIGWLQIRFGRP